MPDKRCTGRRTYIRILACILLLSCAKQGFPPGGPEDKTPPAVVKTQPGQRETGVNPRAEVILWFSEAVQTKMSADAVFISPFQGDNVRLKWRGNRLKIVFLKPMRENTTYVITLGTAIQDYRNNRLASSFSLAFSTGEVLDEGEASGRVVTESSAAGLDVWAYKCDGKTDPDPTRREPDYIVQCSERGEFRFNNVAPVRYRLFAVRDRAADRLYTPGDDEIGVPCRDAAPGPDGSLRADSLFFKMRREESAPPSLTSVTATDRSHLSIRFDRMLSPRVPPSSSLCSIGERDRPSDSLEVKSLYLNRDNARELIVLTANQTGGTAYALRLRTDWIENAPDSLRWERVFRGGAQPDTARPKLVMTHPKPRERYFNPLDSLRLDFSEAMDTSGFRRGFVFSDSSKKAVPGVLKWPDPAEVLFIAGEPLANYRDYSMRLSGIFDAAGNVLPDSTVVFRTSTTDTLSEIGGTVRQAGGSAETGAFVFTASQVGSKEAAVTRTVPSPGVYRIPNCLPGKYVLECFRDLDGNGRYSFGAAFPFKPSEPFAVYGDTVKVRSRWPNEGNDIVLP
jgi:hypothetical protein